MIDKEEFKESYSLTSQYFQFLYSAHLHPHIDKNISLIEAMISFYVESLNNLFQDN